MGIINAEHNFRLCVFVCRGVLERHMLQGTFCTFFLCIAHYINIDM